MWLREHSLGGIRKGLAAVLMVVAAVVIAKGAFYALDAGGASAGATALGAVASSVVIGWIFISDQENKYLKILEVLAYWGFVQIGICWGLLIPLFYAVSLVAIIVGFLDSNLVYLRLFFKTWILLAAGFIFSLIPVCSLNAGCKLDEYNRIVPSIIFILIAFFLIAVIRVLARRMYLLGALVDDNLLGYLTHGLIALNMLHTIKNTLTYLDKDKTVFEKVRAFLSWYFMQIYNVYISATDLLKAIVTLNDLLKAIYEQRFLSIKNSIPKECSNVISKEKPFLGGIFIGIIAEIMINAYKHTTELRGEVGHVSITCESERLCIRVENMLGSQILQTKRGIGLNLNKILIRWLTKNEYFIKSFKRNKRHTVILCILRK